MTNISQIFEEHGTNTILLDPGPGTAFGIVKIDEEAFELREMLASYIEDCLPEETKENYILKTAGVNGMADEGRAVSDEPDIELEPFENLYTAIL